MNGDAKQNKSPRQAFLDALRKHDDSAAIALLKEHGLEQLHAQPDDAVDDGWPGSRPPVHLAVVYGSIAVFDELVAAGGIAHEVLD